MNAFTQMLVSNSRVNGMLNKCSLLQAIDDRSVKLPEDDYLTNDCKLPYVFLGDDAFALKEFMKKPYPQQNLTADKRIYNYRHSRARRILENLFGILTNCCTESGKVEHSGIAECFDQ